MEYFEILYIVAFVMALSFYVIIDKGKVDMKRKVLDRYKNNYTTSRYILLKREIRSKEE